MIRFFSQRNLKLAEIIFIPEAVIQLFLARVKVSYFHSKYYFPATSFESSSEILTVEKEKFSYLITNVINGLSTRTIWKSTCLVKVLAANKMLSRRKIPHVIHFGVNRNFSTDFKAHAWLSVENKIMIGGENAHEFQEIVKL